jgi:hypothetical protein
MADSLALSRTEADIEFNSLKARAMPAVSNQTLTNLKQMILLKV